MTRGSTLTLAALLGVLLCQLPTANAVVLPHQSGGSYTAHVRSFVDSRFHNIVRQQYDYSCGSAAVATLLTYHYDRPVSEEEVFLAMFEHGDQARIQRDGFSMLDMRRYLETQQLRADGFRITLEQLRQLGLPAIALIDVGGFRHFVVIKGVTWDHVLIGDPALGMTKMTWDEFRASSTGLYFIIRDEQTIAQQHFNLASEWAVKQRAPLNDAVDRSNTPDFRLSIMAGQKL
ncbi:hypothetical protein CAI21_00175 [Alkalilimnicola ehrlichii]|uniref:Peptidase C39 domain-containing protein n=1 Tax=Alkalilimnicola ehrlichii TaxID=351052 RepID=A0A3E0X4Y5_9GAMM|nr:C39 family peptidase [Alkalilimnicola ehrlichii]RFA31119.1 hypothetical protein CAI21_00175 [Alkalilimnicola ehrlichii]RFA39596.1 hypothetical protein CAL65_02230 [Alkalilimnicola ehrlichii]